MSSPLKNAALVILTLAVAALGTLHWQQNARLAELEASAARLTQEATSARQRLAEADQRLASAEKRRAELEAEQSESRRRTNEPRGRAAAARAAGNPLDNPAVQKMMATGMRSTLDQRFGGLFRQLKLSPAELEKLKDLLTERQMSGLDAMNAARAQGLSTLEIPAVMGKVQAEVDRSIRELLGAQRFERYEHFNENIGSYAVLDQIERRLGYTNAPLEASQSEALLRVLIDTAPSPPSEVGAVRTMLGFAQGLAGASPMLTSLTGPAITEETITRASRVLSPAQTEVLRQLQNEQQSQTNVIQSLRMNAIAPGSPAGAAVEAVESGGAAAVSNRPQSPAPPTR